MISELKKAKKEKKIMNVYFAFDDNYYNQIPFKIGEKLFLTANEYDFLIDGFSIQKIKDIEEINIKDDICSEILEKEGILDNIAVPDIDIQSYKTVFEFLKSNNKMFILSALINGEEYLFVVGEALEIEDNYIIMRHFDANGKWQKDNIKIMYSDICIVSFDTRYVNIFSKYLEN